VQPLCPPRLLPRPRPAGRNLTHPLEEHGGGVLVRNRLGLALLLAPGKVLPITRAAMDGPFAATSCFDCPPCSDFMSGTNYHADTIHAPTATDHA
jgi:hypothetical protein